MRSMFMLVGDFHRRFDLPLAHESHFVGGDSAIDRPPSLMEDLGPDDGARLIRALSHLVAARDALRESDHPEMFRLGFAVEEKAELVNAVLQRDLEKIADALADSIYVDAGTAHFYRIPLDAVFQEVHEANMAKERGPTEGRGHHMDVRKPEGWLPPDVAGILRRYGWEG